MRYRSLICLAVLGSSACGAEDMEDIEVSRFAVNVANGTEFKDKLTANPNGSYTLTADIDMGGNPLQISVFTGTLDGAGRTIRNVTQLLPSTSGDAGLFAQLQGTVRNLRITGVDFKALSAGGLASKCNGATVQNVTVAGKVEAGSNAGGICGSMSGGSITGSSASGTVKSRNGDAGGLVGRSSIGRSGLAPAASNCSVTSMTVTGVQSAGGLMGYCQDPTILRASINATVSGELKAGGICGEMNGGSISNSYAKGTSVTSLSGPAGGLVGIAGIGMFTEPTDRIQIRSAYAQYTNVTANTQAGGLLGTGLDPFLFDVYAVGNVTGTGAVGGLIGRADSYAHGWTLNNGIYRGVVTDRFGP
jgi:mucin-19